MRRGFTFLELLMALATIFVIVCALTRSVSGARRSACLSKAQAEMASIVAEVGTAENPEEAAARYADGQRRDPWGNAYRVALRRTDVKPQKPSAPVGFAVWYPNGYAPKGGAR